MSILIEQVKTHSLVKGSFRKVFTVPTEGDVTITTYLRGTHHLTITVSLEEARRRYKDYIRPARGDDFQRGWSRF